VATGGESNQVGEDRIGGYRYVRTILPGQNSTIYEVADDATGKHYAIKQMVSGKADDAAERRSFEAEAKLGMELRHPNLVRVHRYVKDREAPFFVMDYFPSEHLRLILNRRDRAEWLQLNLRRIIEQSGSALAYLHDRGLVHRDIKPENLLVNRAGEVRLIDLAIARKPTSGLGKLFGRKPPREGTPSYMSPEQIRCEPPSPTADIYSLGCTCYELACGRPPFRANSTHDLLSKHLREPASSPRNHNPALTAEFSDLVLQMIRKGPAERPKTVMEILGRLARIAIFDGEQRP
jgi:serine/threonine protein kinase